MSVLKNFFEGFLKKAWQHIPPFLCPLHKDGWPIATLFFLATVLLWHIWTFLGLVGLTLTVWCFYFFRDPTRVVPLIADAILSPADGLLLPIVHMVPPQELGLEKKKHVRLSIFMNIFDVHVNRFPIDGILTHVSYHPGRFLNAALEQASEQNEHKNYVIKTKTGILVAFVQVAGLLARRIKSGGKVGDEVRAGERVGIIRFGSRVDLYLPLNASIKVLEGQKIIAGETILAMLKEESHTVGHRI